MTSRGIFAPVGLVLVLLPQVSGCLERSDPITGVRVVATWSGIEPDQLSYALVTPDGSRLGAPEVRPAEPADPLTSGATVVVYLGHDRADQPIRCDVEALAGGRVIAVGSASVVVARLKIVELPVVLTSSIGGGAPRDGGAVPVLMGHGPSQSADDGGAAPASVDASADAEVGSDSAVLPPPPPLPDAAPLSPDLPLEDPNKGKPRGSACQSASECASGHCTDGALGYSVNHLGTFITYLIGHSLGAHL